MLALSLAKSASKIRPLDISVLSFMLARLLDVWLRRLMLAPNWARIVPTALSAVSNSSIALPEVVASVSTSALMVVIASVTSVSSPLASNDRVSALLAPIWKVIAAVNLPAAANSASPAYLVLVMMLVNSLPNSSYSGCSAVRSSVLLVSFAAWVARSFMRCMISVISLNAPSAVCNSETAPPVLRIATSMPRDCAFKRVAICKPAASSAAELIRTPVPRRCWLVPRALLVLLRLV